MNILENLKSAMSNILSNKLRTLLTTLGIIIGITAVIVIVSIGKGFENDMNEIFSGFDSSEISLSTSYDEVIKKGDELNMDDLNVIEKIPNVEYANPDKFGYAYFSSVESKGKSSFTVDLITENMQKTESLKIKEGRLFTQDDMDTNARVILINEEAQERLFNNKKLIGKTIQLELELDRNNNAMIMGGFGSFDDTPKERITENFLVVGILKNKPTDTGFYDIKAYIPINTYFDVLGNEERTLSNISIKIKDMNIYEKTKETILQRVSRTHRNYPEKYNIFASIEMLKQMQSTIQIFTTFISFVAGIALLVGGIGVMNIMLVTVTERTREIGIRKALGATRKMILQQFLIEAISVSLLGGGLGVLFGYIGSRIAGIVLKAINNPIVPDVSVSVVIGSVLISCFIGIVFGVYPASKASKLDPIEALRYE